MRKNIFKFIAISILMSISTIARAHIGTGTAESGGFIAGFTHPLLGLDHLLAMLAIGLWAGQASGKILWVAPLSFMTFMVLGSALGILGANLPITEHAILVSLIVFGGLVALSIKSNTMVAMVLIGTFAIFHGHSHGTEMAVTASATQYTIGFVLATGLLHLIGIAIAKSYFFSSKAYLPKVTGSSIAATGLALMII